LKEVSSKEQEDLKSTANTEKEQPACNATQAAFEVTEQLHEGIQNLKWWIDHKTQNGEVK